MSYNGIDQLSSHSSAISYSDSTLYSLSNVCSNDMIYAELSKVYEELNKTREQIINLQERMACREAIASHYDTDIISLKDEILGLGEIQGQVNDLQNRITWHETVTANHDADIISLKDEILNMTKASSKKKIFNFNQENNMMMKNFDFGPCTNDNVRMSAYGIAIKNTADTWVSYNNGQVIDVDAFNFDGRQFMFKMPVSVKDVKVGDVVIHNRVPMFITNVHENNTFSAIDVRMGEAKVIIPTTNMFNFNFVTKVVSLFDVFGNAPTADQPFGNMLPFLMMSENEEIDPMMMFMLMSSGDNMDMNNPMMLYLMMNSEGTNNNWLLPFMMMNNKS